MHKLGAPPPHWSERKESVGVSAPLRLLGPFGAIGEAVSYSRVTSVARPHRYGLSQCQGVSGRGIDMAICDFLPASVTRPISTQP